MKNRLITLLLFVAALLWIYAKNRRTQDEWEHERSQAFGELPWVQEGLKQHEALMQSEKGEQLRSKIAEYEIDHAINQALARTKEQ